MVKKELTTKDTNSTNDGLRGASFWLPRISRNVVVATNLRLVGVCGCQSLIGRVRGCQSLIGRVRGYQSLIGSLVAANLRGRGCQSLIGRVRGYQSLIGSLVAANLRLADQKTLKSATNPLLTF